MDTLIAQCRQLLHELAIDLGAAYATVELLHEDCPCEPIAVYQTPEAPADLIWLELPIREGEMEFARLRLGFASGSSRPRTKPWRIAQTLAELVVFVNQMRWQQTSLTTSRASRRILSVTEEELQRIILDVHDGPVQKLISARLAADIMAVPTILVARTDAFSASLITTDIDPQDEPLILHQRSSEGYYYVRNGVEAAILRGLTFAPYADLIWWETSEPNMGDARQFAEAIHERYPGKMLAYNCSPSFNWKKKLDAASIAKFQRELGAMGYKFQFVTLAGFHALNHSMYRLARDYRERGMAAYADLQESEFASEADGYTATKHQREVGTGYFDEVATIVSGGAASTLALLGSTEEAQFA